jgi:hypothetical protein
MYPPGFAVYITLGPPHTRSVMSTFELFRYQLLPASQHQHELFTSVLSADQVRERKNEFFDAALKKLPKFRHRGLEIRHRVLVHQDDWFIFKVGAHKTVDRDTEDFQKEKVESWPNVTVIVNNQPDVQVLAVSKNPRAFSSTAVVSKMFERTMTSLLREYGLSIQVREQFESANFWTVINKNDGNVLRLRFEMVAPNMANISRALKIDLKQLNRDTNAQQTNIELEAPPGGALEVSPENELIDGCVEYSSLGGGDIAIKVRGLRKEIRTSTSIRSVEIDELTLQAPVADLLGALKKILAK